MQEPLYKVVQEIVVTLSVGSCAVQFLGFGVFSKDC